MLADDNEKPNRLEDIGVLSDPQLPHQLLNTHPSQFCQLNQRLQPLNIAPLNFLPKRQEFFVFPFGNRFATSASVD